MSGQWTAVRGFEVSLFVHGPSVFITTVRAPDMDRSASHVQTGKDSYGTVVGLGLLAPRIEFPQRFCLSHVIGPEQQPKYFSPSSLITSWQHYRNPRIVLV